ncbi:MAG: acyltransferase [Bacteroidales bacterium]|nr:acyltransferase [Bacteroidales bacterium]
MKKSKDKIFNIRSSMDFETLALEVFRYQAKNNETYSKYLNHLGIIPGSIYKLDRIPFLPIEFFKTRKIITGKDVPGKIFTSSGTTGAGTSKHYVTDISLYQESFTRTFQYFYGNPEQYCILALLPSYLEREGSSLIYMMDYLIKKSNNPESGFYLDKLDDLAEKIVRLREQNQKILLFGVSFALLNLAEKYKPDLSGQIVMETGGMKGRREEIIREELHKVLCKAFNTKLIHSEYGMTELLSQAYSKGDGIFHTPPWMKILIRDGYDPFSYVKKGRSGGINVIDLANYNSCSFIETSDLGLLLPDGGFEVSGRFDSSDIRGCNLMVEE